MDEKFIQEYIYAMLFDGETDEEKIYYLITHNYSECMQRAMILLQDSDQTVVDYTKEVAGKFHSIYSNYLNKNLIEYRNIMFADCLSINDMLVKYSLDEIKAKFDSYCKEKYISLEAKCDMLNCIEGIAGMFRFDDETLIRLIEASSGCNIIRDDPKTQNNLRYETGDNKVLRDKDGNYTFRSNQNNDVFTLGGEKITPELAITKYNKHIITSKILDNLFDNILTCFETINMLNGKSIQEGQFVLADGSSFDYVFKLNDSNIPHLLGIPRCDKLPQKSIDNINLICGSQLNNNSSATELLRVLLRNRTKIIECSGIYLDTNGREYELINWEKAILRTIAFMRGDFFKRCFCLAKLADDKYLVDPNIKGGLVSISTTSFKENPDNFTSQQRLLVDLLSNRRMKKDFIFRGFLSKDNILIPNTIVVGKAENLYVGKEKKLLSTLQRYRNLFDEESAHSSLISDDIGSISSGGNSDGVNLSGGSSGSDSFNSHLSNTVVGVLSEDYVRYFSPAEQLDLGIDVANNLGMSVLLSEEAKGFASEMKQYNLLSENDYDKMYGGASMGDLFRGKKM